MNPVRSAFPAFFGLILMLAAGGCSGATNVMALIRTETPTASATPSQTATVTPTPSPTLTPTATFTPSPSPTATWVFRQGKIVAPILLYHHIENHDPPGRYYVPVDDFAGQMKALHDWGYTTITPMQLITAITNGAELPAKPVVITFDDGDLTVYSQAFPLMKQYDFTGAVYVVGNYLDAEGFMSSAMLKELAANGWEIGAHSMSHLDLTQYHKKLGEETAGVRSLLETELDVPVKTFAYPFGEIDAKVVNAVGSAGYSGGMGLGIVNEQGLYNLYYLSRREVEAGTSLEAFREMLSSPSATASPTP